MPFRVKARIQAGDSPAGDGGVMLLSCVPFSLSSCGLGGAQLHVKICATLLDAKVIRLTRSFIVLSCVGF